MEVQILLDCTHVLVVPVESVLLVPQVGTEVKCAHCGTMHKIVRVGTPYRVTYYSNKNQPEESQKGKP